MSDSAVGPRTIDGYAMPLIRRIVGLGNRRLAGGDTERAAHDLMASEFDAVGLTTEWHAFEHNVNLYATMALHFAVAALGSLVLPWAAPLALLLHLLAAISYIGDSRRRFMLLRRLFPFVRSRNLLGTAPATAPLRRRIVLLAHIDAAFTGIIFNPALIKAATAEPPIKALRFMRKSLLIGVASVLLLAALDVWVLVGGWSDALLWPLIVLSIPSVLTAVFNLDVVLRNHVVPGANDNLTGTVSMVMLAERLVAEKPDDVELVFVVTGAEEAGTGGAWALARDFGDRWSTEDTVVLGVDTLSGGTIRWLRDGELLTFPNPEWLETAAQRVADSDARFAGAGPFDIPSGATDALPFHAAGYEAISITCVDPDIGAPRNYHHPSDTPENLDPVQFGVTVDFLTRYLREMWSAADDRTAPRR